MSDQQVAVADADAPIYGVKAIAAAANLTIRQTYHALEKRYLDADKFGRKWRSTARRIRAPKSGEVT